MRELPPGTYYYFDLIDCEVLDENDRYYGRVIGVEEYSANDVLVIESNGGKSCLLPMVKEYVLEVDIENKKIIIAPPEGIFESSDES